MKSAKTYSKLLMACIALISVTALLQANYYKPDFFPIGLTGLNHTGPDQLDNCPYSNVIIGTQRLWYWDANPNFPDQTEQALIEALGVNCLGVEDIYHGYLINLDSSSTSTNNYLDKICIPSLSTEDTIFLLPATYFVNERKWHTCSLTCEHYDFTGTESAGKKHVLASLMFRSYYYGSGVEGWGSMIFSHYYSSTYGKTSGYGCHGYHTDNWSTCDTDTLWHDMADEAIGHYTNFLSGNDSAQGAIWGYNLISEEPAVCRAINYTPSWKGCWAAVDRIFTGHKTNLSGRLTNTPFMDDYLSNSVAPSHSGMRGIEDSLNMSHRFFIAKYGPFSLHRDGYDIFEALPDLDAFVIYKETWCKAYYNYGEQGMFDTLLYGTNDPNNPYRGDGYHNDAVYMQKYGKSNLAYSDQKRRWIPGLGTKWSQMNSSGTIARSRRPCPPELRCAVYLCLSRGAKGVLFHQWTRQNTLPPGTYPIVPIPCSTYASDTNRIVVLRDYQGYPFGYYDLSDSKSWNHVLNNGQGSTFWHENSNRRDRTYEYLKDELIPEIKLVAPKLMELDWVNAYSFMSTDPEWNSPCPHYYMEDVWGVDYMDVGFFDHPYEPIGVEYFMLVNREGIADMTLRDVGVALDAGHWPEEDTLILTNIAEADNPRHLVREGDRYVFTEIFEPGEGKLYRVAPMNEAPVVFGTSPNGGAQ